MAGDLEAGSSLEKKEGLVGRKNQDNEMMNQGSSSVYITKSE